MSADGDDVCVANQVAKTAPRLMFDVIAREPVLAVRIENQPGVDAMAPGLRPFDTMW
jgi:hypothetical protein